MMAVMGVVLSLCMLCSLVHAEEYALLIDAGSTGSRAFLYRFWRAEGEVKVEGQKAKKIWPGLSSFSATYAPLADAVKNGSAASPSAACVHSGGHLAAYLVPALQRAAELVPVEKQSAMQVYIQGTAGMRLVEKGLRAVMWACTVDELHRSDDVPGIKDDGRLL
jgi:Golgi nucleoside diphosphatase